MVALLSGGSPHTLDTLLTLRSLFALRSPLIPCGPRSPGEPGSPAEPGGPAGPLSFHCTSTLPPEQLGVSFTDSDPGITFPFLAQAENRSPPSVPANANPPATSEAETMDDARPIAMARRADIRKILLSTLSLAGGIGILGVYSLTGSRAPSVGILPSGTSHPADFSYV